MGIVEKRAGQKKCEGDCGRDSLAVLKEGRARTHYCDFCLAAIVRASARRGGPAVFMITILPKEVKH